jgi:hypothetical protein
MKQSSKLEVTLSLNKAQPKVYKRRFKARPLKSLSTGMLWILIESIEYQLRNSLFCSRVKIKALQKRLKDLSTELDERIEYDEFLCKLADEARIHPFSKPNNPIYIDKDIEDFRKAEEDPNRKSKGKVYVRGSRLRPGKKIEGRRRIKRY